MNVPDECNEIGYTDDSSYTLEADSRRCLFVKPGLFFGNGLIVEVYWQNIGSNQGFNRLGPVKSGCVVNINADYTYVLLSSQIAQTVQYFPSNQLSHATTNYAGTTYNYTTFFSSKALTQYNLSMVYKTSRNSTFYSYEYLLLLGDEIKVTDHVTAGINEIDSGSTESNPYPTKTVKDGAMNFVSFGTITIPNDQKSQIIYRTTVNASLKAKTGIPEFAGTIPTSPSIATIKDVDNAYVEPAISKPITGTDPNGSTNQASSPLNLTIILGAAIAVLAVIATISVFLILRKRNTPQIEGADQQYSSDNEDDIDSESNPTGVSRTMNTSQTITTSQQEDDESYSADVSIDQSVSTSQQYDATASMGDIPPA